MSPTAIAPPEPRVRRKTFTCTTGVQWTSKTAGALHTASKPDLPIGGGEEGLWTPEDLFVASVNSCTMSTFMALAEKRHIAVEAYSSEAVGTLEYVDGAYRFTEIVLRPQIVAGDAADAGQVQAALDEAHRSCLIGNSIRGVVVVEPAISFSGEE